MIHTHIMLNERISLSPIISRLKKDGVLLEPIEKHYLKHFPKRNLLKLNVSNVKETDIETGIAKLADAIGDSLERSGLRISYGMS